MNIYKIVILILFLLSFLCFLFVLLTPVSLFSYVSLAGVILFLTPFAFILGSYKEE